MMYIFILAGGFGTRLQSVVSDLPKPMALIENKHFLDYQIDKIRESFPFQTIHLLTHHMSDIIENHYKKDKLIKIIKEKKPLGTGGSISNAIKTLNLKYEDSLLVLNGDTYLEVDFLKMIKCQKNPVSILSCFQKECSRYGTLKIEGEHIISFQEKKIGGTEQYINAGCYFFQNLNFFANIKYENYSLESSLEEYLIEKKEISTVKYEGIFIDIGIPEDYIKMQQYIKGQKNE